MADRGHLRQQLSRANAALAERWAASRSESALAIHVGGARAVLAPDRVNIAAVPVDLEIEIIPVQFGCAGVEEVPHYPRPVGRRDQVLQFAGNRALSVQRDDGAGKGRPAAAVEDTRGWIVDGSVVRAEITAPLVCGRHRHQAAESLPFAVPFPAREIE